MEEVKTGINFVPIILGIIGILWTISIGLIVYIFKSKDADIKDIKNGMHSIQLDTHSIKKDSEYNSKLLLQVSETVTKQGEYIAALKINEAKVTARLNTLHNEIETIKKLIIKT